VGAVIVCPWYKEGVSLKFKNLMFSHIIRFTYKKGIYCPMIILFLMTTRKYLFLLCRDVFILFIIFLN